MAQRVLLHVGTPKSGTTYLQTGLWQSRDALRGAGVVLPGEKPFDHNRLSIVVRNGEHLRRRSEVPSAWTQALATTRAARGTVVISNEWFLACDHEQAVGAVEQLGGDAVEVVVTTRDLVRLVPAGWQESLKIGRGTSLGDFVAGLDDGHNKWTWQALDPALVARRWADVVGPERVHVVTSPQSTSDPSVLWDRFTGVLGLAPGAVPAPILSSNESLTVQAARLLQEYGPTLKREVAEIDDTWRGAAHWMRNLVVRQVLVTVPGDPIGIGEALADTLRARAERTVADLRQLGCPVTGDLDDLLGGQDRAGSRHPDSVTDAELVDAGRVLAAGLLRERMRSGRDEIAEVGPSRAATGGRGKGGKGGKKKRRANAGGDQQRPGRRNR